MQDKRWPEEEMISLLKEMPMIKDTRSKEALFHAIEKKLKKKRRKQWITPLVSMAAAAAILVLLSPPLLQEIKQDSSLKQEAEPSEKHVTEESAEKSKMSTNDIDSQRNLVLNEVPEGKTLLTYGITDPQAVTVIPVSVTVDHTKKSIAEMLMENSSKLPLQDLGLGDFMLAGYDIKEIEQMDEYQGKKINNGKYITVTVPEKNALDQGAGTRALFNDTVSETFRWLDYNKAEYYTGEKPGIYFEHFSEPDSGIGLPSKQMKAYWLYQLDDAHPVLLAPILSDYRDFKTALLQMQQNKEERNLKASIPPDVIIEDVVELKGAPNITVKFKKGTTIDQSEQYVRMFEAIMMTAAEFSLESVSFDGIENIEKVGNISMKGKNPVPIAPNPVELTP